MPSDGADGSNIRKKTRLGFKPNLTNYEEDDEH